MNEEQYKDIMSDAGADYEWIENNVASLREQAGDDAEKYAKILLDDALEMLNRHSPEVEDLYFYAKVNDNGETDIIVECSETDSERVLIGHNETGEVVYDEYAIYDMLVELEESRDEEEYEYDDDEYEYDDDDF